MGVNSLVVPLCSESFLQHCVLWNSLTVSFGRNCNCMRKQNIAKRHQRDSIEVQDLLREVAYAIRTIWRWHTQGFVSKIYAPYNVCMCLFIHSFNLKSDSSLVSKGKQGVFFDSN